MFIRLARNLGSGLRLAFLRRVRRHDFRIGIADLLVLVVAMSLFDIGVDFLRYGSDAEFSWFGVTGEMYGFGVVMLVAGFLGVVFRRRSLVLSVPIALFASYPALQLVHLLPHLAGPGTLAATVLGIVEEYLLLGWSVIVFVRSVAVGLDGDGGRRVLRSVAGGLLLFAPLWFGSTFSPHLPWWRAEVVADSEHPNPASEPVMEAQKKLLDDALGSIEDGRAGVADFYAVAVAASPSDALRADALAALKVLDERWATDGRSVALVNHPASLLELPMASFSNLRASLEEIRAAIDPDEDVVLVYLAGNGNADGSIDVDLPPLDLVPLAPARVRRMLDEIGIRWRIIVVSACGSGAWIDALANESTVVMTATGADGEGPGCSLGGDGTAFGSALFGAGFVDADTIAGAFEIARGRVIAPAKAAASTERATGPQLSMGTAIAAKLKEIERGRAARRADRSV
jgi:hypothetical protein